MNAKNEFQVGFLYALAMSALLLLATAATAATIDDFSVNQATITGAGSATQVGATASTLGGERDLQVTVISGGPVSVGASLGLFSHSQAAATTGSSILTWDGNDNDATTLAFSLGPANLTTGGDNAFLLGIIALTGSPTIKLDVFTSAANWSTFTLANPTVTPTYVRIPYAAFSIGGGSGASFSSVGAIRLTISAGAAADVKLDFLRTGSSTAPTPLEVTLTDVVLVDNDSNGKASAGDTLRYIVTITNTGVTTLTNVQYSAPAVANAGAPGQPQGQSRGPR